MRRIKLGPFMLMASMATAVWVGLVGCASVGYDRGPEWDGGFGNYGGYYGGNYGRDRDQHSQAFHADAGSRESDRGRASMGSAGHGGGGGGHR